MSDPSITEMSDPSIAEMSDPSIAEMSDDTITEELSDHTITGEMSDPTITEKMSEPRSAPFPKYDHWSDPKPLPNYVHWSDSTRHSDVSDPTIDTSVHPERPPLEVLYSKIIDMLRCRGMTNLEPECVTMIYIAMKKNLEDFLLKMYDTRRNKIYKESIEDVHCTLSIQTQAELEKEKKKVFHFAIEDMYHAYEVHPDLILHTKVNSSFRHKVLDALGVKNRKKKLQLDLESALYQDNSDSLDYVEIELERQRAVARKRKNQTS